MRRRLVLVALAALLAACANREPGSGSHDPATASSSESSAAPAFDVEGFCEQAMGVGRPCTGDDELMEGNKIGLCTTQLRAARDEGVTLDAAAAERCLADATAAAPPLPDVRTLKMLAERFATCRAFAKDLSVLGAVGAVPVPTATAGTGCETDATCVHGTFCDRATKRCAAQKKANAPCQRNSECIGRCSHNSGNKCQSYCGSG